MGKREFLIIAGFVLAGLVAYELTAAPGPAPERRFSLSRVLANVHREMRGNRATARATSRGTIPITAQIREIRVTGAARVTVAGTPGTDVEYEMSVQANGPDEATAHTAASQTPLTHDDLGDVLALTVAPARETRQVVDLTLRVPPQMLVRFGGMPGSANLEAHGVAALELDGVVGDVQAADIGGHVSGTHRNGSLTLTNARDVTLTLVASNATFTGVTGTLSLTARNGETHVERSAAQTTIDATNQKVVVTEPGGPVRLTGSGGELVVDRPLRETHVDVRRMAATITIAAAVPVSVITSDAPVHLALVGEPAVAIDAIATDGGHVTAADFDAEAASVDQSSRIAHVIAGGTTRVVLRNARGDIEITRGK